jgi:glycosyltransferase involved in cell wall biosynthesis
MRLCLLGEYAGNLDEGMRKVSFHFAEELSKEHQVLTLDLRDVFTKGFWKSIKNFNPQIIHYVHGPSLKSFILLKVLSRYCRDAKTVMSAMHQGFSLLSAQFIKLFKPGIVLVQSIETEARLKKCGCETEFLGCGVDVQKFRPVAAEFREGLRDKYGRGKDKFVILHVGSLKRGRNAQLMERLQKENDQVIIVGAVSTGIEKKLTHRLKETGCLVWTKHFKNIEEIYLLSDCYIFPAPSTNKMNSIEMPLSVLEAMSCNLPVITTKFGALPRVFEEGNGLFFVENEKDISSALEKTKNRSKINTREKVMPYSWDNVGKKLERIYETLLGSA